MTIFIVNWLFSSMIASPNICTIFSILAASSSVWTLTSCIKTVETVTDSVINGLYSLWILRIGTLGTSATSNVFEACLDKVGWNHGIWTGFLGWQSGSFALFLSKSSKFSIPSLISEASSLVPEKRSNHRWLCLWKWSYLEGVVLNDLWGKLQIEIRNQQSLPCSEFDQ